MKTDLHSVRLVWVLLAGLAVFSACQPEYSEAGQIPGDLLGIYEAPYTGKLLTGQPDCGLDWMRLMSDKALFGCGDKSRAVCYVSQVELHGKDLQVHCDTGLGNDRAEGLYIPEGFFLSFATDGQLAIMNEPSGHINRLYVHAEHAFGKKSLFKSDDEQTGGTESALPPKADNGEETDQ